MDAMSLAIKFELTRCDPIGTLEAILSTARRGGLTLAAISYTEGVRHHSATMQIRAEDADRLSLFLLRLGKVITVRNVAVQLLLEAQCVPAARHSAR